MAFETFSTNMLLPLPGVGLTSGPQWAQDVNNSLTIIDGHNHTPGYGVPIPPSGLNINSDLSFNGNNATDLRSTRFNSQGAVLTLPSDLNNVYVVSGDLYFNDGNGNNVQITQNGAVAGTPGSIANLVPPASASYVTLSGTFVFQSNVNTAANMDIASLLLRNNTPSSFSLTLAPPNAMSSNTVITLPTIPATTSILTIDNAGNISTVSPTSLVPVGSTMVFAGSGAPAGFLIANGAAVSRTTYANLFGVVGTTYGVGDGATTFNLPNGTGLVSFSGVNSVPSYIQSYWPLNAASGGEPNEASTGATYDLVENGTVPTGVGYITANARGPFTALNYLRWPAGGSSSTIYDLQTFFVDGWFNTSAGGVQQFIIGKTNTTVGWSVFLNAAGQVTAQINSGGPTSINSTTTFNDGNYHYFAVIYSNITLGFQLYVDNVLEAQATFAGGLTVSTADLVVGLRGPGITNDFFFQGLLESISFIGNIPSYATMIALINARWNGGSGMGFTSLVPVNYIIKF